MSVVSEFCNKFHNFQGITIGDRKKELFILLKEYNSLKEDETAITDLINNLRPVTYLEHILQVKILIHFKRRTELFQILIGENETFIKYLWKETWFFRELVQINSPDFIVNELFKDLSYVNRIKFLRNVIHYTEDERKIDALYEAVLLKYGPGNAKLVLVGCSLAKKQEVLKQRTFKFNNKQLIFLHENKREHFDILLNSEYSGKIFDFYDYNSKAFSIIAGHDLKFFMNTFEQNRCLRIGKSLTKKLLKTDKQYVVDKAKDIHKNLHQRTLLRNLRTDFKVFFFDTWPKSYKNFNMYNCMSFLKYYPESKYFEIIQEGLHLIYNKQISDCPQLINEEILQNTKNVEIRETLVELKMKSSKDDYTLAQYYGIDKSIGILKKKINMADGITTRENLIKALVNTCEVNNDINALLEVMKYFNFRHRNDDQSIRSSFLSEINTLFDITDLTKEHWDFIIELLKWSKIKNDNFWLDAEINVKYIKFLHKNNATEEDIRQVAISFFGDVMKRSVDFSKILADIPQLEKLIIKLYCNNAETTQTGENDDNFGLFLRILSWNQRNPDDQINFCQYKVIEESVFNKLNERSYRTASYFHKFIRSEILCDEDFEKKIENIFWDGLSNNFEAEIIEYYLRKKPLKIIEHSDIFIENITRKSYMDLLTIWRLIKSYDHLKLPEKIVEFSMENKSQNVGLATLIHPAEYLKMMSIPSSEKLDLEDDENTENYRTVEGLLRYAKFLNSSSALPVIVEFCKGDYLHTALAPLYFYFFHVAEKHLDAQLEILSNRAVSVRKHTVKLACSVSPIPTVYKLIKNMTDNEKNQSALNHLFAKTFKYFLVVESDELWSLVQIQIKSLDLLESQVFRDVCTIKKIPDKFKMTYLNFIWEILDEAEKKGGDVSGMKEDLMRSLDSEVIEKLPYEFCSNLIKQRLFRSSHGSNKTIESFAINCMKYGQSRDKILGDIFLVMAEFHNYVNNQDSNIARQNRRCVEHFVSDVYFDFSYEKNLDNTIVESFYANWKKLFNPIDNIESFVKVTLLAQLKKIANFEAYVSKIAELFNAFVEEFGILGVIECFMNALNHTLPDHVFNTDNWNEKKYKLASKLIELHDSVNTKLLAIHFMPQEIPENAELKGILFKFIELLKECKENSVQVNLNLFIASMED